MEIKMPMPEGSEEPQQEEQQQEASPQPDPIEIEARQHGWRPKEEFEADERNAGKKWRTADDFMDRKSLFDKIDAVQQENKTLKKGVQNLSQHYQQVEKRAYEKALADLKAQRIAALEDEDLVRAERIRDEMDEVKEKMNKVQPPVTISEPPSELIEWKSQNTWYQRDDVMTNYADGLGNKLLAEGKAPGEILREVERRVRQAFPEKFRNPNKDTAPEVVGSGKRATAGQGTFRLTEQEEKILNTMIRAGAPITREEYIRDLKAQRGQ